MTRRVLAPIAALAALATAQTAQAQQQACVAPGDVSDAAVYAMPIAFEAVRTTCANRLARNGFMATRGEDFIAPFKSQQDKAWPGAFRLIKTFMDKNKGGARASGADIDALIGNMPDSALRPFVDALVLQSLAEEIKPDSCKDIERALELLSPLPTENVGGLLSFLVEMVDPKNPPVCKADQSAARK
jgi:hypothetical protein